VGPPNVRGRIQDKLKTRGQRKPPYHRSKTVNGPGIIFDLDGMLVDSVYEHVISWKKALEEHRDIRSGLENLSQDWNERKPVFTGIA